MLRSEFGLTRATSFFVQKARMSLPLLRDGTSGNAAGSLICSGISPECENSRLVALTYDHVVREVVRAAARSPFYVLLELGIQFVHRLENLDAYL